MDSFHQGPKSFMEEQRDLRPIHHNEGQRIVSVWLWILILILTAIPVVNLISLLILAFFVQNKTLQNYGRASLIVVVIPATFFWLLRYFS